MGGVPTFVSLRRIGTIMKLSHFFRQLLPLCAVMVLAIAYFGCGNPSDQQAGAFPPDTKADEKLPDISLFRTKPSDRFLVDVKDVTGGHPYKGVNAARPHAGAHVHFDNSRNVWPKGKDEPGNYPAVYAIADGVVSRVDTHFALPGGNDRYGLDLEFAKDEKNSAFRFCYSIEPMAPEPAEGFYKSFLLVRKGQRVRIGDVIAYLYTPPNTNGCHIHFHLMKDGVRGFLVPALFTPEIAQAFHEKCNGFREFNGNEAIPPCMGYRIGAEENPFGTGAKDEL